MSDAASPASTAEAMDMVLAGLSYLAAADPTTLAAQVQAECLQAFEQAGAIATAARAWFLAAFTAGQGYGQDADYSPTAWLIHRTKVTKGAALGLLGWSRRVMAHPQVALALAEGTVVTESMARIICGWTGQLPADCRPAADEILLAAARAGAAKDDLAGLAAEIYARSLPADDDDPEPVFEDRQLRVETTFAGAGVITGDLTPECAAVVTAVLEALAAPMGAEDTRTREQRYHDALQEAMRRLAASGLLPERAGQPVKAWAHISLAELRARDDGSLLETEWITEMRIRWAAHRAHTEGGTGSDGGAWLSGDAARAVACDATITPVVTGNIDPSALDDLVRLCVRTGPATLTMPRLRIAPRRRASPDQSAPRRRAGLRSAPRRAKRPGPAHRHVPGGDRAGHHRQGRRPPVGPRRPGLRSCAPASSAARLAGPSLPLDIGFSKTIPPGIRNAVILRDRKCRWPGGCHQPAAACQVHHVRHLAHGGPTSLAGLRAAVQLPPPGRDPPLGLDPGAEPGRDHHRLQPRPHQGPVQPQPARPRRVNRPAPHPLLDPAIVARIERAARAHLGRPRPA